MKFYFAIGLLLLGLIIVIILWKVNPRENLTFNETHTSTADQAQKLTSSPVNSSLIHNAFEQDVSAREAIEAKEKELLQENIERREAVDLAVIEKSKILKMQEFATNTILKGIDPNQTGQMVLDFVEGKVLDLPGIGVKGSNLEVPFKGMPRNTEARLSIRHKAEGELQAIDIFVDVVFDKSIWVDGIPRGSMHYTLSSFFDDNLEVKENSVAVSLGYDAMEADMAGIDIFMPGQVTAILYWSQIQGEVKAYSLYGPDAENKVDLQLVTGEDFSDEIILAVSNKLLTLADQVKPGHFYK